MKAYLILLLFLLPNVLCAQLNPNQAYRGETLVTTVSTGNMTISSGLGSTYTFSLQQGGYVIPDHSHTFINSGLGFATGVIVTFVIPYNALVGFYDFYIKQQGSIYTVLNNSFRVYETALKGRVFFDENQNGIFDGVDQGLNQQNLIISPTNTQLTTDINGRYISYLSGGYYGDSLIIPSNFTLTSSTPVHYVTVPPDTFGLDFGLYTPPDSVFVHDFVSEANQIRCQRPSSAGWEIVSGSNNLQTGTITMVTDANVSFVSSTMPATVNGNIITWQYTLHPFERLHEDFVLQGTPLSQNTSFEIIDSLFDATGTFISAQVDSFSRSITCSYDPNDKIVFPAGIDSVHHYTLKTEELKFTIRFQNCGNDTAYTVTIRDTISSSLDMGTFRIEYASSPVSVQISNTNQIRFTFDNILLPDSNIDELHSHGMLVYSIRPKPNVPDFTIVKNRAYIYFDLNDAVITNTTLNTLVTNLNVGMDQVSGNVKAVIYPNPSSGMINIALPSTEDYIIKIYSMRGELIISDRSSGNYTIKSNELSDGIYYYEVREEGDVKSITGKFIIAK